MTLDQRIIHIHIFYDQRYVLFQSQFAVDFPVAAKRYFFVYYSAIFSLKQQAIQFWFLSNLYFQ